MSLKIPKYQAATIHFQFDKVMERFIHFIIHANLFHPIIRVPFLRKFAKCHNNYQKIN